MVELFEKLSIIIYVTLDHKTSHKGTFFFIEIIQHQKAE